MVLEGASPLIDECYIFDARLNGVHCVSGANPVIANSVISNVWNGIWCESGSSPSIEKCTISTIGHNEAGGVGIGVYSDTSSGLSVANSLISDCNGRGIVLKDATDAVILTTTITDSRGANSKQHD